MTRLVLIAALAAALLCGASANSAVAKKHRACPRHGGHTVLRTSSARVWYTGLPAEGATYYGCLGSARRVRKLVETQECFHQCDLVRTIRLNGRYVAWVLDTSFSYGGGVPSTVKQSVQVYDLKAGKRVTDALVYSSSSDHSAGPTIGAPVASLLLASTGHAAALLGSSGNYTLEAVVTPPTILDRGAIDPASLKLSAGVLSWTNGGTQHSQPL